MKTCNKCKKSKDFFSYSKDKTRKDGLQAYCKTCVSNYHKQRYPKVAYLIKDYQKRNPKKYRQYKSKYQKNNKELINKYFRNRRASDENFRLLSNVRSRVSKVFKRKKPNTFIKLLGCTVEELKRHLELKFMPGMSWNNYGRKGWHVDHITPICKFDFTKDEDIRTACHYKNLQPLWEKDNLRKSGKPDVTIY